MFHRYWFCIVALAVPAGAQTVDEMVAEALRGNREILAAQKKYEASRQRPVQAGSMPEPTVSLGYTSNGGPWPVAGIGSSPSSNAGLMIAQEVPFPGKRKLRGEIAGKEAGAEFEQYRSVRLSVIFRVVEAYHELHHAMVGLEYVDRYQKLLQNVIRISEARYSVGRAAQQDIFKAQTQYAIFETQKERYQEEQSSKKIELNALLNRPADTPIDVPEEMEVGEMPGTLDELLRLARDRAPALARDQKMIERSRLSANLARKDYYPDYVVSGGYFNQGAMPPMWQFRVDFKLPVYFWGKQRAAVNEQEFAAGEARHNYEATAVDLEAQIRSQYVTATTARKLLGLYEKSVIPEAKLALESSMAGYETGSLDFLSLFSNFMTVVDYELRYHEELMRFHVAVARLEELSGVEVAR